MTKDRIADAIDAARKMLCSRETSLVIAKLEEAELWRRKFEEEAKADEIRR